MEITFDKSKLNKTLTRKEALEFQKLENKPDKIDAIIYIKNFRLMKDARSFADTLYNYDGNAISAFIEKNHDINNDTKYTVGLTTILNAKYDYNPLNFN